MPTPHRAFVPALALALAAALPMIGATSGCIGKRRPRADDEAAAKADTTVGGRLIQPEDVDGSLDALVEGERLRVRIDEQDPTKGAAIPLVTIVEFSDFQCPFCSRLATTLDEIVGEYGPDVKLVFKQFPLAMHPQAEPAARAALAAQAQGKFWPMHDAIFANQRALTDEDLEGYAREAGLDVERWRKDFGSEELRQHVKQEMELGTKLGVRGTPVFYVNGRFFSGAQPTEEVRRIVEEELAAARTLLEAGAKREELYARFLHKAPALPGDDGEAKAEAEPDARPAQPGVPADAKPDPDHVPGEASRIPNYAVPTGEGRPSKGPADALVTIVEFGAFDCEACRAVQPALQRILAKHPKDVRLVFRQLPEGTAARRSAQIALAAHRQGKFWQAHDRLLAAEGEPSAEAAQTLAKELGLDVEAFGQALRDRSEQGPLRWIQEDVATVDVFRGEAPAPIFFVNGRYLDGTPSFEDFDRLVQEEKAKAEKFRADEGKGDEASLYEAMRRTWRGYAQVQAAVAEDAPQ